MSVIFIVLPLALIIGAAGVAACLWAASRGQFDDLETPPLRMMADDDAQRVCPERSPRAPAAQEPGCSVPPARRRV